MFEISGCLWGKALHDEENKDRKDLGFIVHTLVRHSNIWYTWIYALFRNRIFKKILHKWIILFLNKFLQPSGNRSSLWQKNSKFETQSGK